MVSEHLNYAQQSVPNWIVLDLSSIHMNKSEVYDQPVNISRQPYHPAAQDRLLTETKQGWASLLLEEVLVRPAEGAHPVVCVGPNAPV